jgi:hypothetical protein
METNDESGGPRSSVIPRLGGLHGTPEGFCLRFVSRESAGPDVAVSAHLGDPRTVSISQCSQRIGGSIVSEPTREQARELNAGVVSLVDRLLEKHTLAVLQVVRDELAARDARLTAARSEVESVRRFHFAHNPPNTGLAAGFNSILDAIDGKPAPTVKGSP